MAELELPYRKLDRIERLLIEIRDLLKPPPAVRPPPPPPPCRPATERQIRELSARGYTVEEISTELRIERVTVESILERVIIPPTPPTRIEVTVESLERLADLITSVLQQMPNRLELIEIDTSDANQRSLRTDGKLKPDVCLGFEIETIGGGFTYVVVRKAFGKDERTAVVGARWNIEFDDLLITGSGTAGTARLWYWWREPPIARE